MAVTVPFFVRSSKVYVFSGGLRVCGFLVLLLLLILTVRPVPGDLADVLPVGLPVILSTCPAVRRFPVS